jgi:hypothetical protein
VSGAAGSNECPAGSVRIVTEAACRTAATAAGKTVDSFFVVTYSGDPRGCYYTGRNKAYFNPHPVGAGVPGTQLLCAAATTGAPPLTPMRAGVHRLGQRPSAFAAFEGYCMVRGRSWGTHTPPTAANQPKSFEQHVWAGAGSARQCGALRSMVCAARHFSSGCSWGSTGYSRRHSWNTQRVLKGYSPGTHGYSRVLMGWYGVFPPALVGCVSDETVLLSTCHAAQGSVLAPWGALFPV